MPLKTRVSADCCRVQDTTPRRTDKASKPELFLRTPIPALRSEAQQILLRVDCTPPGHNAEEAGHRDDAAAIALKLPNSQTGPTMDRMGRMDDVDAMNPSSRFFNANTRKRKWIRLGKITANESGEHQGATFSLLSHHCLALVALGALPSSPGLFLFPIPTRLAKCRSDLAGIIARPFEMPGGWGVEPHSWPVNNFLRLCYAIVGIMLLAPPESDCTPRCFLGGSFRHPGAPTGGLDLTGLERW